MLNALYRGVNDMEYVTIPAGTRVARFAGNHNDDDLTDFEVNGRKIAWYATAFGESEDGIGMIDCVMPYSDRGKLYEGQLRQSVELPNMLNVKTLQEIQEHIPSIENSFVIENGSVKRVVYDSGQDGFIKDKENIEAMMKMGMKGWYSPRMEITRGGYHPREIVLVDTAMLVQMNKQTYDAAGSPQKTKRSVALEEQNPNAVNRIDHISRRTSMFDSDSESPPPLKRGGRRLF